MSVHRCDPRSDQQCPECYRRQCAEENEAEKADALVGRTVWVVLRHFESDGGPSVDLFATEDQARQHARRVSSDATVGEESIFASTWLDENGEC